MTNEEKRIYNQAIQDFIEKLEEKEREDWISSLEYGIDWSDIEEVKNMLWKKEI